MLEQMAGLANPLRRREAARALAASFGSDELIIFISDPELGLLLPAPGFPQTLPGGRAWRAFLNACLESGTHTATLSFPDIATFQPATGVLGADGSVLVLLGGTPRMSEIEQASAILPLLAAAFRGERETQIAEGHAAAAREAAAQARLLAESLDIARRDLQRALDEAREARARAAFLAEASALFSASLDVDAILASVTRMVVPRFAHLCLATLSNEAQTAQRVALAYVAPQRSDQVLQLSLHRSINDDAGGGLLGQHILEARTDLQFSEALFKLVAHEEQHSGAIHHLDLASTMGAPLLARGKVIGSLWFGSSSSRRPFDTRDQEHSQDLAQRAALAIDNARLYQEAKQAIEVRDEFLSIAAHELKTPVTSLVGYTQVMQRRAARENKVSERDQRGLQVIASQAERLSRLINSLLDISSIQSGHFTLSCSQIDLCTVIRNLVDDVRPLLDTHELEFNCPNAPVFIYGDALRLELALQNLIQNAVKYSPDGGAISLTVERRATDVAIRIRDQGIGIAQSDLPGLFQRFFRATSVANSNISGIGIGLFVVREIVSRHGGQVEVSSVEGAGSTFVIHLPLVNSSVPTSSDSGGNSRTHP